MRQDRRRVWGIRDAGIVEKVNGQMPENFTDYPLDQIRNYLRDNPLDYCGNVESLLELLYQAFTEYDTAETPKFKEIIDPLDQRLRNLARTDEEADEYMGIVYSFCVAYERQGYVEGMKVGAPLMMELMED